MIKKKPSLSDPELSQLNPKHGFVVVVVVTMFLFPKFFPKQFYLCLLKDLLEKSRDALKRNRQFIKKDQEAYQKELENKSPPILQLIDIY